ncbi:MAG: polysaccharide export protein [Verrucomicrobiae bacterium]|nr:polysaccharide export protein [Verrucomicrobiae bacterium]
MLGCISNAAAVALGKSRSGRWLLRCALVGLLTVFGTVGLAANTNAPSAAPTTAEYRIQPSDLLDIHVYQEPDLSLKVRVRPDGKISYPLLGSVAVAGLTVTEVQEKLTELLAKDYLVNPRVSVSVEPATSQKVLIIGQVKNPGSYEIPRHETLTVLQLIARAGGFTDIAAQNRVTVIRGEGSKQKRIVVNVPAIISSGDRSKDIVLEPGDVVSVPETFF